MTTKGVVLYDYVAAEEDELTLYAGESVTITQTYDDGWWLVSNGEDSGLAPSNYIQVETKPSNESKLKKQQEMKSSSPRIHRGMAFSNKISILVCK